ncbi:MAG: sugar transferase [Ruminococcaceae bacterium]|nr:sugar transferase [Oscillospiraceae bacterium]
MNQMKEKYKRLALIVDALVLLTWETSTFGIIWINFYNDRMQFAFFQKGNWLLFGLYLVILYVFSKVYKGLKIGSHKTGDIIVSQVLATFCTNVITYFQISLIARQMLSPVPLLFGMIFQVLVIVIWAKVSGYIIRNLYPAKNLVVIYGLEAPARNLVSKLSTRTDKYNIVEMISVDEGFRYITSRIMEFDGVAICDTPNEIRNDILKFCFKNSIRTYLVPKISDIIVRGGDTMELFDTPLILSKNYGLGIEQRVIKRAFDIFLSSIGIIIASPFMLATAIAIKLCDKGPVLYKQERLTIGGKVFKLLKFRSMVVNAESDGVARLASSNDSRVTPVGKIIRKIRFDELPQLFNIFKGDMSVVGPRPERPEISEQYEKEMPEFSFRLKVKAGLTGNAQVVGKYNTTPYDKLKLDLMYIERYSIAKDILLILKTVKIIFMPDESTEGIKEGYITPIQKGESKTDTKKEKEEIK